MSGERAGIFRGDNGRWYIRHYAPNGFDVVIDRPYRRRWTARRGARRMYPTIPVFNEEN